MRYAFFPGCSLESTAWDYDVSVRATFAALGVELTDIPEWSCCGSTPAHASNASLAVALPVMNLLKAREMGRPVLTACASCYARLRTANHKVKTDPAERERAGRIVGKPYDGGVPVHHILEALTKHIGADAIAARVTRPLSGVKVACYYGCLLTRPPEVVAFEDHEHPMSMDTVMSAAGAEVVDWPYKTECCGAGLSMTTSAVVNRLGHNILAMARQAGADCLAVACPLCQVNLDLRQRDAAKAHGSLPETPVLFVTQLLGLALGLSPEALGIEGLFVSANGLVQRLSPAKAAGGAA
ncbi:MAG: CoB--CoM heterodisulfide reductase iron-sulfur subunit B family protein [Planctomycetota bacterium]|nr:CoB--CoM heterodisulfide reductase iron-sulfur subunit B family protein [Planctomycetota bacterium]